MKNVMYAFSGDPITFGHMDIIERSSNAFGKLFVGIGENPDKRYMFNLEERTEMAKRSLASFPNLKVVSFPGLLADYAYEYDIGIVVRGVRNAADFDSENKLHEVGRTQNPKIDTHILFAKPELACVSSSHVKAIQKEQGMINEYVPLYVKQCLEGRMSGQYIIGVTGEIGAGKSYVSQRLIELGKAKGIEVHNIDLDQISHQILGELKEPVYGKVRKRIVDTFGTKVRGPKGTIERKHLGEIVFNDSLALEKLNEIMATPILVRTRRELYSKKGLILLNGALLAESDMSYLCNNNNVLVYADRDSQKARLESRGLGYEQMQRRLESQFDFNEKKNTLEQVIKRDNQGKIWTIDNSDGKTDKGLEKLFDKIIMHMDQYGEMRFRGLWSRLGADATPDEEYKKLLDIYLQGHRVYHSLSHIVAAINEHEKAKHLMERPDEVLFALFYHDSVMKKMSRVDEERSGQLAYSTAKNALLPEEFAVNVRNLCIDTKHNAIPQTNDGRIIIDIDLSILGKPTFEFNRYERAIRQEYSWVPEQQFKEVRRGILEKFLKRAENHELYLTDFFRDNYESRAITNLQSSIDALR